MLTCQEIKDKLKQIQPFLQENYSVHKIGIFGSFVRNEATEESDIDLLVELSSPLGWKFFELQELLEKKFGKKVDLVSIHGLKKRWKDAILKDVIYI